MNEQVKQPNVKVKFLERSREVDYSNFAAINHSSEEFLFDFGNIMPGAEEGPAIEMFERIALSPRNAKLFANALIERLKTYEATFGEIRMPEAPKA